MFSQPKILVCTDFSEASDRALRAAKELAHKTKGEIHLLHVAEISFYMNASGFPPEFTVNNQNLWDEIQDGIVKVLHEQAVRCKALAEVKARIDSSVTNGILKDIEELKADVVVIGSKEREGLEKFLFGNVAKKICASSPIPVLVIKNEDPIEKVAALVDGNEDMSQAIDLAQEVSFLYSSSLSVLSLVQAYPGLYSGNILEYSSAVTNAIRNQAEAEGVKVKEKIERQLMDKKAKVIVSPSYEKDVAYHLAEVLQDEEIDLAVLRKHHKPMLERFFLGSVSGRVLEQFPGNLLIC